MTRADKRRMSNAVRGRAWREICAAAQGLSLDKRGEGTALKCVAMDLLCEVKQYVEQRQNGDVSRG
nr:MAG TPA: hypothetical protein [Caudoviricetes sp.]